MKEIILDMGKLEEFRKEHKLQPFRVNQIIHEIFKNSNIDFAEMTTLSKDLRTQLADSFDISSLSVDKVIESEDTTKFSFRTRDDKLIEAVLMYHHHDNGGKDAKLNRITICLSSQIGCAIGCSFCVTGKLGFTRNLSHEEMISQVLIANNYIRKRFGKKEDGTFWAVRNVVFMGMGEPLLNYENFIKTINMLLDQKFFSLSRRHITISTSGIVPGIQRLIDDDISVKLAISLHCADENVRAQIMKISETYDIDSLIKVLDKYVSHTDNRIFYEYIMIDDLTDTPELAHKLGKLLKSRLAHVNLISYNENPAIDYKESTRQNIQSFKKILENYGVTVTVRQSMGRNAKGACGQLGYEALDTSIYL